MSEQNQKFTPFAVFDAMAKGTPQAESGLKLTALSNITSMKAIRGGTRIVIEVNGDVIKGIMFSEYVGGLVLAEKSKFEETVERMEKERRSRQVTNQE